MRARRVSARALASAAACVVALVSRASCVVASRSIVVVGSVNADVIARVARVPVDGETLVAVAPSIERAHGGKGANQAVAAARLSRCGALERGGASFVGKFGADDAGDAMRAALGSEVDLSHSSRSAIGSSTGLGFVMLTNDGGASAVVVPGANALDWHEDDATLASELRAATTGASTLMLQREVPERVNLIAARVAREVGVRTIVLDAGGSHDPVSEELLSLVDYVAPNESELAGMAGVAVDSLESDEAVIEAARKVAGKSQVRVLCTLGARGSALVGAVEADVLRVAPSKLPPGSREVDATAAGDAFRAAFAVAMSEGKSEREAMRFASAAGALAVTKLGAMPSLPLRRDVDELLGEESSCAADLATAKRDSSSPSIEDELAAQRFASRLNSMKSRMDLFPDREPDVPEVFNLIKRMGRARGITHVFFNYPEHFVAKDGTLLSAATLREKVVEQKLLPGAVCVRFPEEPFRLGGFTNPDPAVRSQAVALVRKTCETAAALGADEVVIWPRYDGYDYNLQADYAAAWDNMVRGYKAAASSEECAALKVSVEFKPTDEKSRFSFIPSTGAALLLVDSVGEPNFGLTLDVGHMLAAGENPAQSVVMAAARNVLFGVQLGDGHSRLGAEDGLMFGSVHTNAALELVAALRERGFAGILYFDTFPLNEDPLAEASANVDAYRRFHVRVAAAAAALTTAASSHDALIAFDALVRA